MNNDLISRSALKKEMDRPFWEKWEWEFICKSIDNAPTVEDEIKWHNLKENPNDKPTKVGWYCCKISSSDDLKMVFGQSEVMSGRYDAWLLVREV